MIMLIKWVNASPSGSEAFATPIPVLLLKSFSPPQEAPQHRSIKPLGWWLCGLRAGNTHPPLLNHLQA